MKKDVTYELLDGAQGTIEAGEHQHERLEEFTERVGSGEFHIATDITVVCGCIDGRCGCTPKPNSAGGSETLMVADDLINKQFAADDGSTHGAYANILNFLRKINVPIGGHDDQNATGDKSGCGANDLLPAIYHLIATQPEKIRDIAEKYGIKIDDATHAIIAGNATSRTQFSPGSALRDELGYQTSGGYDHLYGKHTEVIAVLNTRHGTTLDRDVVEAEFGPDYKAFNIDVWAFNESANVISTTRDSDESRAKVAAMAYYNFATALTLCGPKMRVLVLE